MSDIPKPVVPEAVCAMVAGATKFADELYRDYKEQGAAPQLKRATDAIGEIAQTGAALLGFPGLEIGGVQVGAADVSFPIGAHGDKEKKAVNINYQSVDQPKGFPAAWGHPEKSPLDGKCGVTCAANMLRFYGIEKDPKDIDRWYYRSWGPGLRPEKLAEDLQDISGMQFTKHTITDGSDPLDVLRKHIDEGKPVAIQYTPDDITESHWLVVTGMTDTQDGPLLTVQAWGRYFQFNYNEVKDYWREGWEGPYPYVVADTPSPLMPKKPK